MSRRWRPARTVPDGGAVTAEFAVALPALVLLLGFGLGAIDATLDKLRCVDAARDAALAQARGADGVTAGHARAPAARGCCRHDVGRCGPGDRDE